MRPSRLASQVTAEVPGYVLRELRILRDRTTIYEQNLREARHMLRGAPVDGLDGVLEVLDKALGNRAQATPIAVLNEVRKALGDEG